MWNLNSCPRWTLNTQNLKINTGNETKQMNTFTDYLKERTKKELIVLAKFHHMTGYSSLRKEELAQKLSAYLLLPEVIYSFFVYLGEDELYTFFHSHSSDDSALMRRLYKGGYCFRQKDNSFIIPDEPKRAAVFTEAFRKDQKIKGLLLDCLNTIGCLYGCAPVSILLQMYNANSSVSMTRELLLKEISNVPEYHNSCILKNDLIIHRSLYEHELYRKIQQCQGTLPFYMPSKKEILHLSRYGAFPEDSRSRQLSSRLTEIFHMNFLQAQNTSREIQAIFRQGGSINDVITYLTDQKNLSSRMLGDKQLLSSLNEMFSHTRLMLNRGNTAAETVKLKKKKTKIYPNSPCPCGSGKKYKNCCGKR